MQVRQEAQITGKHRKRVLPRPALDTLGEPRPFALSKHDQLTSGIRDMIVDGDYEPGQRLVETDLCAHLGVSRTPLREALKVLAGEGLVELQPHRGATVTKVSAHEVLDLFTVMAELESLAAALCCRRITADGRAGLEDQHRAMLACHAAGDRHGYFELNHRIHAAIVQMAGNTVLAGTHERLMTRARRRRFQALLSSNRWDESVAEHEALMAALRNRQPPRAAKLWRRHVLRTGVIVAAHTAQVGSRAAADEKEKDGVR